MKKRIISILCALVMTITTAEPIFAAGTDDIYAEFSSVSLSGLSALFTSKFSSFSISSDGNTYNLPEKNMIILDAWHKGFSNFDELNQNVTAAAAELREKKANPTLSNESGYGSGYYSQESFTSPASSSPDDIFKVGGKEFILLDKLEDNGETLFYVMAKNTYGEYKKIDSGSNGKWNDADGRTLPYNLTNAMAFGTYSGSGNLPEEILSHLDFMHVWDVEPGAISGYTSHHSFIAPISAISVTEYKKYASKIGKDSIANYWTRTPVKTTAGQYYVVNANANVFEKINYSNTKHVRPVFYLESSFFKEEKIEKCGQNVIQKIDSVVTESDLESTYSDAEIREIFGKLSVTPSPITGDAMVGSTLSTSHQYEGEIELESLTITWEKSLDKSSWTPITGASGTSYQLQSSEEGYYIRAAFAPIFDSGIFRTGEVAYTEPTAIVGNISTQFKNVELKNLNDMFKTQYSKFAISTDGNTYTDTQKNMIILAAWSKGFEDFEELDQNVTEAAAELLQKVANPVLSDDPKYDDGYSGETAVYPLAESNSDNVFKIGGKEFILLDSKDGKSFVMAKDFYGDVAIHGDNLGVWDDTNSRTLAYRLTNWMAFGEFTSNMPVDILKHLDVLHVWDFEASARDGYKEHHSYVAPISVISITEYNKYKSKIGLDGASKSYWTRTPVKYDGAKEQYYVVSLENKFAAEKTYNGALLRPVFYLNDSFFSEVALEKCGANVSAYIESVVSHQELEALYGSSISSVFDGAKLDSSKLVGDAIVGKTISAEYTYTGELELTGNATFWQKSLDKEFWENIPGASDASYQIKPEDAGYYLRAAFAPTFNSILVDGWKNPYTEPTELIKTLYDIFNEATLKDLRKTFIEKFDNFSISKDGYTYTEGNKSMIILKAWRKGFSSFEELDQSVTEVAEELKKKIKEPVLSEDSAYDNGYSAETDFKSPAVTNPDDVFKIGDKEFILLDSIDDNGKKMFFVMTKDFYGKPAVDGDSLGQWDDSYHKTLPYKMTNQIAYGQYSSDGSLDLPAEVLEHLDIMHVWDVEAGSREGYKEHHSFVAPISVISVTEYNKYADKIGIDGETADYWTRTPVKSSATNYYVVKGTAEGGRFTKVGSSGGHQLRLVFYLDESFFKEELMQKSGKNVSDAIESILTESDLEKYGASLKDVFGRLKVDTEKISGDTIVGQTLTTGYSYAGDDLLDVVITWERKLDDGEWQVIPGAYGNTYTLTGDDVNNVLRAVFTPTFNRLIFKNGEVTYELTDGTVYESQVAKELVTEIKNTQSTDTVKQILENNQTLFLRDPDELTEGAAQIFVNDANESINSVSNVRDLFDMSVALDAFANAASDEIATEKLDVLMGDVPAYNKLTEEQKANVVSDMKQEDKSKVSTFTKRADDIVMLERFSNIERGDSLALFEEYEEKLKEKGADLSGLTEYQLERVGTRIALIDHGINIDTFIEAVNLAKRDALSEEPPKAPSYGGGGGSSRPQTGGYVPSVPTKPAPSGDVVVTQKGAFADLGSVSWARDAINILAEKGILSGNGDGTFSPERYVTRNEFVTMLVNAFGIEMSDSELHFADIEKGSWSEKYIAAAVSAGIVSGIDESNFGNGMNITRQDAAVIAARVMQYKGVETEAAELKFTDSGSIADYAMDAVAKMNYCKVINGLEDNSFAPHAGTTRAQAAVMVNNLIKYYESTSAFEEEEEDDFKVRNAGSKYDIVYTLGILKEAFLEDAKITRAELAAALCAFQGYSYTAGNDAFGDVSSSHTYYKEIMAVYQNNIMPGRTESMFKPDEVATYGEAYEAIIAATGYSALTDGRQVAESALRKEAVYARDTDELTSNMLEKMFLAALDINVFDIYTMDAMKVSEATILNTQFGVYKDKGILNAVAGMAIGGRTELAENKVILTVDSNDYIYTVDDIDYSDYLGYEVTYYYKETESSYHVLGMVLSNNAEAPLKLSFDEILDADGTSSITYEIDNRTKTAIISTDAEFIYNGRRCYDIKARDKNDHDLIPTNGYITLVDTDNDDVYDVVRIENYDYIMVAQVNPVEKTVVDRVKWESHSFVEGKDAEKINITKNGRYIKLDYISTDDILAVAKSRDGKVINVYVCDKKVIGYVMETSEDDGEITIDNNVIKTVRDPEFDYSGLSNNMRVTVGLDWNGYAVRYYTELSTADISFGYLYKTRQNEEDTRCLYILTEGNEHVKLDSSEKPLINGVRGTEDEIDALTMQLIAYSLDSEGKVKKIYSSATEDSGDRYSQEVPLELKKAYKDKTPSITYNNFGMNVEFGYLLTKNAVVFDIALDADNQLDKDNSRVTNVGAQTIPKTSTDGNMYIYNSDYLRVSNLCVFEHKQSGSDDKFSESFNAQAFIVNKVTSKYNEKKDKIESVVIGYQAGSQVQYTIAEKFSEEKEKLAPGDVLLLWTSGSEITRFRRLYASDWNNRISGSYDRLCSYGSGYEYSEAEDDIARYVIEWADGGNSATVPTESRLVSAYGNIELVYKSEGYAYPVIKLRVEGCEDASVYTTDGSTTVYTYNQKTKKTEVLESENLNISARKALITVRYGNVRDVIIYEE